MPMSCIHLDPCPVLLNEPACQPAQETGGWPQGQQRQGQQTGGKQNGGEPRRAKSPGEETVGRRCPVRTRERVIPEGKPIWRRGVHEPGCLRQGGQLSLFTAETQREAERIIPQSEPPGSGEIGI